MKAKAILNAAVTASVSGGAAAVTQVLVDPTKFQPKQTGMVFLAGSIIGLVNWIRQAPWTQAEK